MMATVDASTKHQFIVKDGGTREEFATKVWKSIVPALLPLAKGALKIGLTERENPRGTVLPLRRDNLLMVSAWGAIDIGGLTSTLHEVGAACFGYRVEESYPVRYTRDWADGERSPGDVLLTLLAKNERLSYDEFMHEWHGRHTPKALRIHPMWSYARNVVTASVTDGAPAFEGIVEEHYRELRDITNPVRMFGGPLRFLPHLVEVGLHARHFLDLRKTENYLLGEWHLVGPSGGSGRRLG
jgi:hypothetical protein